MDRINKIGRALINYKTEYCKHYSPIVDESLMIALESQLDKKLLDQEIFDMIINDSYPLDDFEKFIGNKREYAKSQKDLLEEFEKVRAIVNESLTNQNFVDFIETESNIEINKISILRQYTISEEFIKMYFGLEDEDLAQIMKKKGFAEKFAVLRLTKIFKEIYSEMRPETEFQQGFSRVYYNPDVNGFSVDYKYHISVDFITKENIDGKIKKIKDTDKVVERKFLKKSGISFYNVKTNNNTNETLNVPKNAPNNKFSEVEITKEEQLKIQTEIKEEKENKIQEVSIEKEPEISKTTELKESKIKEEKPIEPSSKEQTNKEPKIEKDNKKNKENKENKDLSVPDINQKEEVISIIEEVSNMQIEEDNSGDFSPSDFEGFIEDTDLDIPNDINIPDDLDLDLDLEIDMDFDDIDPVIITDIDDDDI